MRDWNRAELAAADAERAARHTSSQAFPDAVETPAHRAARLRRLADAMLASILDDIRVRNASPVESQPT